MTFLQKLLINFIVKFKNKISQNLTFLQKLLTNFIVKFKKKNKPKFDLFAKTFN